MKHQDIKVGLILALKPERREAYGVETTCAAYLVTGLKYKPGYQVPYVQCGSLFFRPADFSKAIGCDYAAINLMRGNTAEACRNGVR